ncbi:MAG TPA: hypothetical protein PKD70_15905 [Saprospiraceae bacterium]|nr:hypothetical protein [Saprospiraceae bacterium]HMP15362.1 hypothetical protein [Saprospiraceae bacterium]
MNTKSIFLLLLGLFCTVLSAQHDSSSIESDTSISIDSAKSSSEMFKQTVTYRFDFPTNDGAIQFFKPLDFKGQSSEQLHKMNSERIIARVVGVGLTLVLLIGTILLLRYLKGTAIKVIIGLFGLCTSLGVGFLFLMFDAYSSLNDHASSRAADRLRTLANQIGVTWRYYTVIPDENYRLCLVQNEESALIVDYKNNQGWRIPKGQVAAIIANPDSAFAEGKAVYLTTEESKKKEHQHELILVLKGNDPARIHLQYYSTSGRAFDAVSHADTFKNLWEGADWDAEN